MVNELSLVSKIPHLIIVVVDAAIVAADLEPSLAGVEFASAEIRRPDEIVGVESLFLLLLLTRFLLRRRRVTFIFYVINHKIALWSMSMLKNLCCIRLRCNKMGPG